VVILTQAVDTNVTKKGTAFDQRKEGQKHYREFHREMKDALATCHQSLIQILTNAQGEIIGLKGVWTRIVKEVAYGHLDLTHVDLAKVFYYDPPLKERTVEYYVKEHISSTMNAWKRVCLVKGNVGHMDKCPAM
jgi:hypothetical protein